MGNKEEINNLKVTEEILLIQIKQDFSTPADAVSQYLYLIEKSLNSNNIEIEDEVYQIKDAAVKLKNMYEKYFDENTKNKSNINSNEYFSEIRHNLRTPLNAIIGYSEILIEDFGDGLPDQTINDLKTIIDLAKEIEKAIEKFVNFIKGGVTNEIKNSSQLETAKSLFNSLDNIDHSFELDETLLGADILIVDDNVTNCKVLERKLGLKGLQCRIAYDGQNAIKEVEKKLPDLILLDVILPDINGLELLKSFRKKYKRELLPIIMVSAFNDEESIAKCIQLGAQDYLPKPLNGTILIAKVLSSLERKFLRQREKELVDTLHIQATTDQLTGIANRRVVFETLESSFIQFENGNCDDFYIIMMDIDYFKKVNDTYGHSGGDEVLKAMSKTLDTIIKDPNIVGRIGGEEFLAVIYSNNANDIKTFSKNIRKAIHDISVNYEGQTIKITSSGGVAMTGESRNVSDLVNKADKRLYKAKKQGRDIFILN